MTDQELFEKCATHMLSMKERAVFKGMPGNTCRYRGGGTSGDVCCPIGSLIPDDKYTPYLENHGADATSVQEAAGLADEQVHLALQIQRIHDHSDGAMAQWRRALINLGEEHGLNTSFLVTP